MSNGLARHTLKLLYTTSLCLAAFVSQDLVAASFELHEQNDTLIFLHKVQPGPTGKSFGLQVAKLAGIPTDVINSAKAKLHDLEVPTPKYSKSQSMIDA